MFDWFRSKSGGDDTQASGADAKLARLVDGYIRDVRSVRDYYDVRPKVKALPNGKAILACGPEEQIAIIPIVIRKYLSIFKGSRILGGFSYGISDMQKADALQQLIAQLLRRQLPYTDEDLAALLKLANEHWKTYYWYKPHKSILGAIERNYKDKVIPPAVARELKRIPRLVGDGPLTYAEDRALAERARLLLGDGDEPSLKPGVPWARTMLADIGAMAPAERSAWQGLLDHALTAKSARPSKKWLAEASSLMETIGQTEYAERLNAWLANIQREKIDTQPLSDDTNATVVRGLVWMAGLLPPETAAREVKALAQYCFRKIAYVGAVSPKVGNACLYVLGQLPGMDSVAMLNELLQKVKYPSARKMVERALDAAAERAGMSRTDLEELSVPDFGLDAKGRLEEAVGDYTAVLAIEPGQKTAVTWRNADGKVQKSVPAAVKAEHADEVKALQRRAKDIQGILQSQTARIEKLFLRPAPWSYADWRARYIDHPLLRHITHKLIWQLERDGERLPVMPIDGELRDHHGEVPNLDLAATEVRLWHPAHAGVDEVLAWREFLDAHAITQPFKQAHREVYLLTDAERQTEQYSNRFAGHILRQHQMNALCRDRGWSYDLQGAFDSYNTPTLSLPAWNLQAQFFAEGIEGSDNDTGIYNYLSSDQVRFLRDGAPVALVEVEPSVFTEVMRDVDLFVGVCSIGNDPDWQDSGDHPGFNEYWREYAFGELLESAKVRKDVLERLIPRLKIAERCEIDGRFLRVKGKRRTYKIHLGSGNILMEPNDQYLCIVEGRGQSRADTGRLVLPFEGDHRMAVILSKAFLLAEDDKITDKTILNQINAGG